MTQTLKMDNIENYSQFAMSTPDSQFRLNRKYRDTLILHGKAAEEPEEFQFQEFPSGLHVMLETCDIQIRFSTLATKTFIKSEEKQLPFLKVQLTYSICRNNKSTNSDYLE